MRSISNALQGVLANLSAQFLVFCFQPFYTAFEHCYLFVPVIRNELQIFYAVISRVVVLMMDYLPAVKTATKTFSHYKIRARKPIKTKVAR